MEPKWINNSLQGEKAVFWDVDYFTVRIFFLGQGHLFSVENSNLCIVMYKCIFQKINKIKKKFLVLVLFVVPFCSPWALLDLLLLLMMMMMTTKR